MNVGIIARSGVEDRWGKRNWEFGSHESTCSRDKAFLDVKPGDLPECLDCTEDPPTRNQSYLHKSDPLVKKTKVLVLKLTATKHHYFLLSPVFLVHHRP